MLKASARIACVMLITVIMALGQSGTGQKPGSTYLLGAQDQITVKVIELEEIGEKTFRVDSEGDINVPLIGRVHAAGLTVEQLETQITAALDSVMRRPSVTVTLTEVRSKPVSVLGAVNTPGVLQVQGQKTLVEMISMAGGLRSDAGHSARITRKLEIGRIPLRTAADDATGQFSVAQIKLRTVMGAENPEENIPILPYDVIWVPRADMVYVMGEVAKPGGFALSESDTMSVMQALSLSGGLGRAAAPKNAKILRPILGGAKRAEVALDVKQIIAGAAVDVPLLPEDILFIPSNTGQKAGSRLLDFVSQTTPYMLIWGIFGR
jgi:polysaccharide biosynthesis/export protein